MRKKLAVPLICGLVLVSMLLTPTLIADYRHYRKPMKPIRCDIWIELQDVQPPTWKGKIKGDIKGTFEINLIGAYFLNRTLGSGNVDPGKVEPVAFWEVYWEEWFIVTRWGTITVLQSGVWSFETFKFRSNGPVVDEGLVVDGVFHQTSRRWKYLIGSTMYVSGVTNDPFAGDPVKGAGEMWIYFDA